MVDQDGRIQGISVGDTIIQATLYNGETCDFPLSILEQPVDSQPEDYILKTSIDSKEFQNLWVGDVIEIGRENHHSWAQKHLDSVEVITGKDLVEIEKISESLFRNWWAVTCKHAGNVQLRINLKEEYGFDPVKIQLTIKERQNSIIVNPIKQTLKLGEKISPYQFRNLPYGSEACGFLDKGDMEKFDLGQIVGWDDWISRNTGRTQTVEILLFPYTNSMGYWICYTAAYPGTALIKYYTNPENFLKGDPPFYTSQITIIAPTIETNLKKEYKEGQSLEFETTLSNTAYRDIPFDQLESAGSDRWFYYTPKIEILSGTDCCEWVGEASKTTLSFSQKLKFIKAGTITLKVTYAPSGTYQTEYSDRNSYQPEKILTIQVKDPSATTVVPAGSVTLNKSSLRLKQGQSSRLTATVSPSNATNQKVVWTSSNSRVATVNNGTVTAKGPGTVVIKATAADGSGKSASCTITVAYNITYGLNGGKNHKANPTSYYKQTFTLKPPAREKYLFQGWYTDKWYKKRITKITSNQTGNLTLYAKWKKVYLGKGKLTSLKNKKGRKLVVKCKSVSGAGGYQIVAATNRKFRSNKKTITTTKRTATLKKLKKRTYYVKVRAYRKDSTGKKIYGKYSSVRKVKIRR